MTTIWYFYHLNEIGGIETFFYQLGKMFSDRDITIVYQSGHPKQIDRLSSYFKLHKYRPGEKFICKQAIFNFNLDIIDSIEAEEYIAVLHGDYKDMKKRGQLLGIPIHEKITRYVGVSKLVCDSFEELTGIRPELCYNPFVIKNEKPLMLISATRLSIEKGFNRMKRLAQELDRQGIKYLWFIFTNSPQSHISDNVIYLSPRLDIEKYISKFDFLIQLSDNEGYCYSIIEALTKGVPVITTPCPVFKELKLNEKNSITLEFDCSNVPRVVKKMINNTFDFSYTPPKTKWDKILLKSKSDYVKNRNKFVEVEATDLYITNNCKDCELKIIPERKFKWTTKYDRAIYLENMGYVKIIGDVKDEKIINNNSII